MRLWLGSIAFTAYLFFYTAVHGVVVLCAIPFGYRAMYRVVATWARWTLVMLECLCGLKHEIRGLENLPVHNGVILMKHSSAWETIAQFELFPPQCWVVKRELLWIPIAGWVMWLLRAIPINRKAGRSAVDQILTHGRKRIEDGLWVIIYPEGTRMPAGQTRRYGVSGTLLAQAAGQPVVPVAHNAGEFWPRRGLLKRPGTIQVVVGPPIETADRDPRDVNIEVQTWIEGEIRAMRSNG